MEFSKPGVVTRGFSPFNAKALVPASVVTIPGRFVLMTAVCTNNEFLNGQLFRGS